MSSILCTLQAPLTHFPEAEQALLLQSLSAKYEPARVIALRAGVVQMRAMRLLSALSRHGMLDALELYEPGGRILWHYRRKQEPAPDGERIAA